MESKEYKSLAQEEDSHKNEEADLEAELEKENAKY